MEHLLEAPKMVRTAALTLALCTAPLDAGTLDRWHRNRPNPLMPDELPTIGSSGTDEPDA